MKTIELSDIIKNRGLDITELAKELFPHTKFPRMALTRILKGEAQLDADQIVRLSIFAGISVGEIFGQRDWKASTEKGVHILETGNYRAELDTNDWTSKVWHKDKLVHEVLIHDRHITLGGYLDLLESIINNQKS